MSWLTHRRTMVVVAAISFLCWYLLSLLSPTTLSSELLPIISAHSNVVSLMQLYHFPREYYELFDFDSKNDTYYYIPQINDNTKGIKRQRTKLLTGKGVRIVIIDSGLAAHYIEFSHNCVSCVSVVPNVSCESAGHVHGTNGVSVMAGNVETCTHCYHTNSLSHSMLWKRAESITSSLVKKFTDFGMVRSKAKRKWATEQYVGIAPDAEVQVIRVFDSHGETKSSYILDALELAKEAKPHIVSLPYGGRFSSHVNHSKITIAINSLLERGVLVFAAAGNGGSDDAVHYPANMTGVVAVGALRAYKAKGATERSNCRNVFWHGERREQQSDKSHHFYREQKEREELQKGKKSLLMQTYSKYCKAISPFSSGATLSVDYMEDYLDEVEYDKQVKPDFYALGEGVIAISAFRELFENNQNYSFHGTLMAEIEFLRLYVSKMLQKLVGNKASSRQQADKDYNATLDLVDGTSIATSIAAGIAALYVEEYFNHDMNQTNNVLYTINISAIIKRELMDNAERYTIASSNDSSLCTDTDVQLLKRKNIKQHLPVHNNEKKKCSYASRIAHENCHRTIYEIFPPHYMQQL